MTPAGPRRPFVVANWKMHKGVGEAVEYVRVLLPLLPQGGAVDVGLAVPYTALAATVEAVDGAEVLVAAQNMHQEPQGAYTGEVSAPMLLEVGARGVLLGHSERREFGGETDRALQEKVPAALAAGLLPILCVGESEDEREEGETQRRLRGQVQEALEKVPAERLGDVVIAYEPIWAIGTGRLATPELAQEAIGFIRALVGDRSKEAAAAVRVIYGGSVKGDGAAEILRQSDVDGALVGGASLDPESFAGIVGAALQ